MLEQGSVPVSDIMSLIPMLSLFWVQKSTGPQESLYADFSLDTSSVGPRKSLALLGLFSCLLMTGPLPGEP